MVQNLSFFYLQNEVHFYNQLSQKNKTFSTLSAEYFYCEYTVNFHALTLVQSNLGRFFYRWSNNIISFHIRISAPSFFFKLLARNRCEIKQIMTYNLFFIIAFNVTRKVNSNSTIRLIVSIKL